MTVGVSWPLISGSKSQPIYVKKEKKGGGCIHDPFCTRFVGTQHSNTATKVLWIHLYLDTVSEASRERVGCGQRSLTDEIQSCLIWLIFTLIGCFVALNSMESSLGAISPQLLRVGSENPPPFTFSAITRRIYLLRRGL